MSSDKSKSVLISASELTTIQDVVLIDTRSADAFAAGHIMHAINIHYIFTYLATTRPDGIATMTDTFAKHFGAAGLGGDEIAVLYEESMNTGFGQSCRGYVLLHFLGYPEGKICILNGGFAAWVAERRPVVAEEFVPSSASPRKGRIPGAVWIEWYRMMEETAEGVRFRGVRMFCKNAP